MGQISTKEKHTAQESVLFAQRLTAFLNRYFDIEPQELQADGTLLPQVARRGLQTLLEGEHCYFTAEKLRETALWEQDIILPWDYLERAQ